MPWVPLTFWQRGCRPLRTSCFPSFLRHLGTECFLDLAYIDLFLILYSVNIFRSLKNRHLKTNRLNNCPLVAFILNVNVACKNDSHKCLFSRSYLKCITFLASFETLNIPITYELFCNSPKEGMIKGLWKNHSHESMVCTWSCLRVGSPSSQIPLFSLKCLKPEEFFILEQICCSETVSTFLSWQVTGNL